MRRLAVLSLHTSPLAQPGTGDGGGMNVYVRELTTALARAGVECDVYTRAWSRQPARHRHGRAGIPGPPRARRAPGGGGQGGAAGGRRRVHRQRPVAHAVGRRCRSGVPRGDRLRRPARQLLAVGPGRTPAQARARPPARVHLPHAGPGQGRGQSRGGLERRAPPAGRGRGDDHAVLRGGAGLVHGGGRRSWPTSTTRTRTDPGGGARGRPGLLRSRSPAPGPPGARAARPMCRCCSSWDGSSP